VLFGDIPKKIKFQKEIKMIEVIELEFDVEIIVLSGGVE